MKIDLTGKTALITGAASGIGKACSVALAEVGASVIAIDIDQAGAQKTIDIVGGGLALKCNLRNPDEIYSLRDIVMAETDGVDILINCAGMIFYRNGVSEVPDDEWDLILEVNLRSTFLICKTFMDILKERRGGRIITFSSMAARVGGIEVGMHYTTSKAGLIGLTRSLAKEGGPYGITANTLAPGIILTKPVENQIKNNKSSYLSQIPLSRFGHVDDVANAVLFLASPLADYITGVVLDINGGMYMS